MQRHLKTIRSCLSVFDKAFEIVDCIVYVVMIGVVLLQIFARVFLPKVPVWTEESSRFLQVYLVAFAAGAAVKYSAFVRVDTLYQFLGRKMKMVLDLFTNFIILTLFVFMLISSFDMYKLGIPRTAVSMPTIHMSLIYFSMIILSASVLLAVLRKSFGLLLTYQNGGDD